MKKANTSRLPVGKKGLAALSLALINFLSVPAQSAEAIYSNFSAEDAHKIEVLTSSRVAETEKTAVFELGGTLNATQDTSSDSQENPTPPQDTLSAPLRAHTNKTASGPTWTVINPTDRGLSYNVLNSIYFCEQDSSWTAGGVGGLTEKDTTVHAYGGDVRTCFPAFANGFSSYKDGDTLYRGTQYNGGNGGLVRQNEATGACTLLDHNVTTINTQINSITKFQGKLYVGTWGQGVFVFGGPNDTLVHNYTSSNSLLPSDGVYKLVPDNQGNLWIASAGSLIKFDGTNWISLPGAPTYVRDVAIDNTGNVRCGNTELYKYTPGSGWAQVILPTMTTGSLKIKGLAVDPYKNLWAGTQNNGVIKIDGGSGQVTVYDGSNSPITDNWVNAVAVNTTSSTMMDVGFATNSTGFDHFTEPTDNYLPQMTGITLTCPDSVKMGNNYVANLNMAVPKATHYTWTYTGTGVTLTPDAVDSTKVHIAVASSGATPGDVVCTALNNYSVAGINDTTQVLHHLIPYTDVGIDENHIDKPALKIGPNPVTGNTLHIMDMGNKKIKEARIYSADWRLVKDQAVQSGDVIDVDISGLEHGLFFAVLENGKGEVYSTKFLKE